jgi:TonB family protein
MRNFYFTLVLTLISCNILNARVISGKVTLDNHDGAEDGIYVVIQQTATGTMTDNDGNYRIEVADSLLKVLIFGTTSRRYKSKEIRIGKDSIINVTLKQEEHELEEFTIKAYVKRKTISDIEGRTEAQILRVEKEMSSLKRSNTFKHIYDNINYPDVCARAGIEDRMYVRFKIDLEGNIKDAEIKRSLGTLLDQEVLSAIQSAPQLINNINKDYIRIYILPIKFQIIKE